MNWHDYGRLHGWTRNHEFPLLGDSRRRRSLLAEHAEASDLSGEGSVGGRSYRAAEPLAGGREM
jgi:hypothetical protein